MRTLKLHAIFFAVALVTALLTWTREQVDESEQGFALAWDRDSLQVASVHYRGPSREVTVERRVGEDGDFLWATEVTQTDEGTRQASAEATVDAPGAAPVAADTAPAPLDTLQYPVGVPGHTLVARLARLRVIRDMGVLSPQDTERFGLEDPAERILLRFGDGARELLVGDSAFGGSDRYAVDPATDAGYVVGHDIVGPLSIGQGALRERWLHRFSDPDVAAVRVAIPTGASREMARTEAGEWVASARDGGGRDGGARDGGAARDADNGGNDGAPENATSSQGTPDAAFANFMQRVNQLAIGGYGADPNPESTRSLLFVEFFDDDGDRIGFVELLHDNLADRDPYYVRSETTRVVAHAVTSLAERVAQALADIF